ncbi:hypothetical protein MtrunA17_Chr3g0086001 [Medicago truncatula]|uniref:Uncharacterized protein n=1 Tax=Medicago truncatula TaxID=3880 RepID=A0A396IJZ6_MEDTR|nr:hypothetical protein MtrunA17_Chr3g0086001 [Medicago truncatula]
MTRLTIIPLRLRSIIAWIMSIRASPHLVVTLIPRVPTSIIPSKL